MNEHVKPMTADEKRIGLGYKYDEMSRDEKLTYLAQLGKRILEDRYRYYVLDHPVVDDFLYDHTERLYENIAVDLGVEAVASNMVDFDASREDALEAAARVESRTDDFSVWHSEMLPVWARLGYPKCWAMWETIWNQAVS